MWGYLEGFWCGELDLVSMAGECTALWLLKRDVQSGKDVLLTFFCFAVFFISLCRDLMTSADTYGYFCCFNLVTYDVMGFVECVAASRIFSEFRREFSCLACVHNICNTSNILPQDIQDFRGHSWEVNLFTFSILLRLYPCLICSYEFLCCIATDSKSRSTK